eukprot:scaffold55491_cov66-Cyclotella_meneghiniana.AAC.3
MKASFLAAMVSAIGFTSAAARPSVSSKSSKAHRASMKFVESTLSMSMPMMMSLPLLSTNDYTEFGSPLFNSSSTYPSTVPSELESNRPSLSLSSTTPSRSPTWMEHEKSCGSEHANVINSQIERQLEYFYRLESVSFLSSLVHEIEHLLLQIACSIVHNDRSLRSINKTEAPVYGEITAVSASPKDIVSSACEFALLLNYCCPSHDSINDRILDTCNPLSASAKTCHVIQGGLTITVDKKTAYSFDDILPSLFDRLYITDPNVITITYVQDPIALEQTNVYNNSEEGDKYSTHMFLPVAMIVASALVAAGALGTILVLVVGRPGSREIIKNDDETSAQETSESEITSVMSASTRNNMQSEADKDLEKRWPNPFIIAEEEVSNWQNLGILPISNTSRLECIREETSSDDDYEEMSV